MNGEYVKKYKCNIIPSLLILDQQLFKITSIPRYYQISKFQVIVKNEIINEVYINNSFHPNASNSKEFLDFFYKSNVPEEKTLFCIPEYIKQKISNNSIKAIIRLFNVINYDSCYYRDTSIEYQKII